MCTFRQATFQRALVEGAERHPDADAFGGPIRARLEGADPLLLRPREATDHDARPRPPRRRGGRWCGAQISHSARRRVRIDRPVQRGGVRPRRRGGLAARAACGRKQDRLPGSRRGGPPPDRCRRPPAAASSRCLQARPRRARHRPATREGPGPASRTAHRGRDAPGIPSALPVPRERSWEHKRPAAWRRALRSGRSPPGVG